MKTASDRRKYCLRCLEERAELSLAELVDLLGVSEATVRRDLHRLEAQGRLARTHGGARRLPPPSLVTRTFEQKQGRMRAAKEQIARAAAALVQPGMTLALDSGTTVWRLALQLKARVPLRILTSALAAVEALGAAPDVYLHLTGGHFRPVNLDFTGSQTLKVLEGLHADLAILSGDAYLPGRGLYSDDEDSAAVGSALAHCAERVLVLVDSSKFAHTGSYRVLPQERIHGLVTDAGAPSGTVRALRQAGLEVTVVSADEEENERSGNDG